MKREQIAALHRFFYGHAEAPTKRDLEQAWRAAKAIAAGGGALSPSRRQYLLARMSALGTPPEVVEDVMAWSERPERPEAITVHLGATSEMRWGTWAWIVYEGLCVAMTEGEVGDAELGAARAVGAAMDVAPETIDALVDVCRDEASLRRRRIEVLHSTSALGFHFDQL